MTASCPSSPDTPFNPSFPFMTGPNPLQPPKSPQVRAAEAALKDSALKLSPLSPPTTPAPLAPLLPASRSPSRSPSPLPSRAASPQPRALAPPPADDAMWREGDFELVSADNVRFRVQTYHLFSAR